MRVAALILCIVAVLLTLIFAVQFISYYISPPSLSVPTVDRDERFYWEARIARLEPATYLAIGIIGLASAIAGILGGLLGFLEKQLPLARGLMIAAGGLCFFILILPISFLYLAAAVLMLPRSQKTVDDFVRLTLEFIMATFMFRWVTDLFFRETLLSRLRFGDMIMLTANVLTSIIFITGILLGAAICSVTSIMLYKRRKIVIATAMSVTAVTFILMFTPVSSGAALLPFVLLIISLIALAFKLRKWHRTEQKGF